MLGVHDRPAWRRQSDRRPTLNRNYRYSGDLVGLWVPIANGTVLANLVTPGDVEPQLSSRGGTFQPTPDGPHSYDNSASSAPTAYSAALSDRIKLDLIPPLTLMWFGCSYGNRGGDFTMIFGIERTDAGDAWFMFQRPNNDTDAVTVYQDPSHINREPINGSPFSATGANAPVYRVSLCSIATTTDMATYANGIAGGTNASDPSWQTGFTAATHLRIGAQVTGNSTNRSNTGMLAGLYMRGAVPADVYRDLHNDPSILWNEVWRTPRWFSFDSGGAAPVAYTENVGGTVTPAGLLDKDSAKLLSSSTTPAGLLDKDSAKLLASSTTPTGVARRATAKTFTSSSTPAGALSLLRAVLKTLTSSTTPAGVIGKAVAKYLNGIPTTTPIDKFDGASYDPQWTTVQVGCTIVAGRSRQALSAAYSEIRTGYLHDITGRAATVEVEIEAGPTPDVYWWYTNLAGTTSIFAGVDSTIIYLFVAGLGTVGSATYDPVAHRWWRLRERDGQLAFDGSPDGITWTRIASTPHAVALTSLRLILGAGRTAGVDGSFAYFDNLNVARDGVITPTGVARKATTKTLTSSTTPAGALSLLRAVLRTLTSSTTPTGALLRAAAKGLGSSTTPTGVARKATAKSATSSTTPTGVLRKAAAKVLTSSTTPTGTLRDAVAKRLSGLITAVGTLLNVFLGQVGEVDPNSATARDHTSATAVDASSATARDHTSATSRG